MNTRSLRWAVPVVAVVLVLSGCGLTVDRGAGTTKLTVPKSSTEVCNAPSYIREGAPEGLCGPTVEQKVEDNLSLGYYHRLRLQNR